MASPLNKQLDHAEKKYAVRFGWYRYETEQDKEMELDRFSEPPVQPFMFMDYDPEVGTFLHDSLQDARDLYDVKRMVSRFMAVGLPATLRDADRMERIKFEAMTDAITIDQDGQLCVNWHNGELFIEVVEIYENDIDDIKNGEELYEVTKVLARWEVLAKASDDAFFPPWEMDKNHQKNKEEAQRIQDEEIVKPFIDDERLRNWVAALINAANDMKLEAHHFKIFGVLHESGQITARICCQPDAPYSGDQVVLFNRCDNFEDLTTVGQPAKLGEVRWFFETHHSTQALEDFDTWFKSKNS